jgi:hypothetical protein
VVETGHGTDFRGSIGKLEAARRVSESPGGESPPFRSSMKWQVWFEEVYEREPVHVWSGPNYFSPWAADTVSVQHYCITSSLLDKSLHLYYCSVTIYFC